jgi:peptidoglycan/LPS O-acetylase OafA/YrhL
MNRLLERLISRSTVSSSSGLHLNMMDGLRGIAILMVVVSHGFYFNPNGPTLLVYVGRLIGSGWMGVPIFFVLSGFLISYPFFQARVKNPDFWYQRGYAARRALKIIPPFYLVILILAICYYRWSSDPTYFTLGLQWATGIAHYVNLPRYFNTSFWTLWVEIHFYLVLPFLFFLFRGASQKRTYWGMFFLLAVVPPIARALTWPASGLPEDTDFITRRFPNALDNFAWGVLLAGIYVSRGAPAATATRPLARLGYLGAALLAASAVVLAFVDFSPRAAVEWQRFLPGIAAFFTAFFVFDPHSIGSRVLSWPILRFTGIISYEWFLLHQPAQVFFHSLVGSTQGSFSFYLFTVLTPSVLTFLLAGVIYFSFSLPIMRWGRNRLSAARNRSRQSGVAGDVPLKQPGESQRL